MAIKLLSLASMLDSNGIEVISECIELLTMGLIILTM